LRLVKDESEVQALTYRGNWVCRCERIARRVCTPNDLSARVAEEVWEEVWALPFAITFGFGAFAGGAGIFRSVPSKAQDYKHAQ
jgi:hypothetical protein